MPKWSDLKSICDEVSRKWESGRILASLLVPDDLFPLTIPLKRPDNREINEKFAEIAGWIKLLRDNSKQKIGFGYELKEKEIVHRQSGRNFIPTHIVIPTVNDALLLLKKKKEADKYAELAQMILSEWPSLREWLRKHPFKILSFSDDWAGVLEVLRWFYKHPGSGLYIRQLDIPGVDTKFIEQRKGILTELLDNVLPEDSINQTSSTFEQRFGLRMKPARVRLRLLDQKLFIHGMSDIAIPVEQMKTFKPAVKRVFITENEINGLCFPEARDSLVIFGLGYGVDILKTVDWLCDKEICYWGDIDTHGFVMLDQVRSFLPQTKSIMMSEDILLQFRNLWSVEEKPFPGCLSRLNNDEHRLLRSLQDDSFGKGVRLEQERISYRQVQMEMDRIIR